MRFAPLALALAAAPALAEPPSPAPTPAPAPAPVTAAQQALLDRIRTERDGTGSLRRFGKCVYRWDGWKLAPGGVRTTNYGCTVAPEDELSSYPSRVAVACAALKLSTNTGGSTAWGPWRLPAPGGEELLVVTLCANARDAEPPARPVTAPPTRPSSGTP